MPQKPADASAGALLFAANCAACHQPDGMGRPGLAPAVRNQDFLAMASDAFIRQTIVAGRPGTAMIGRPDLKPEQVDSIIAWLRAATPALPHPITVDWSRTYSGDAAAGAGHFAAYCATCHGPHGEGYSAGGAGPAIGLLGFLATASDDFIYQTVAHGRNGTAMRSLIGAGGLANLKPQQVYDIIAHLRASAGTPAAKPPPSPIPPEKLISEGEAIFVANCSACHGADGTGKVGLAPCIRNRDFLAIASDDFIRTTIAKGRIGTSMIPRPDLSSHQVDAIIAWLRSVPVTNPVTITVDPDRVRSGDAAAGHRKFGIFCGYCHGANGEGYTVGGTGPAIGKPGFLSVASDDYIYATVRHGRVGTAMRGFNGASGLANLADSDIHDIISHLRTLNK